jgi:hypothetical protein
MEKEKSICIAIVLSTIVNLILIGMGSYMFYRTKEAIELTDFSFNGYTQLTKDWTTKPYTNITVSNTTCPIGSSNVFNDYYPGTARGCLVTSCSNSHYIMKYSDYSPTECYCWTDS